MIRNGSAKAATIRKREAQDPFVGELLVQAMEMRDAKRVIALVDPYWWPADGDRGPTPT